MMNQTFVDILKKLVAEQGKEALLNPAKCKAFISDYAGNEYKKERRFIVQAAEAGVSKAIDAAGDLASCKKAQARELVDEFGLGQEVAADIVDTLAQVLRGDTTGTQAETQAAPSKPAPQAQTPPAAPSPKTASLPKEMLTSPAQAAPAIARFDNEGGFDVEVIVLDGQKVIKITNCRWSRSVAIPPRIQNLPVTVIGDRAFHEKEIDSVTIPNSVTHIGDDAFSGNHLTSVTIPNSVIHIGESAFSDNGLSSVKIPNSVTHIGKSAFSYNKLSSINIPNSVTIIEAETFAQNQLKSVKIPNSVTVIGAGAFKINHELKSVKLPNSVTIIGAEAFKYNYELTSVVIPDSVTYIGKEAFKETRLSSTSFTVPAGAGIESDAFSEYVKIKRRKAR